MYIVMSISEVSEIMNILAHTQTTMKRNAKSKQYGYIKYD